MWVLSEMKKKRCFEMFLYIYNTHYAVVHSCKEARKIYRCIYRDHYFVLSSKSKKILSTGKFMFVG